MSTLGAEGAEGPSQSPGLYPSFEHLKEAGVFVFTSLEAQRCFWKLDNASLADCVFVMADRHSPDALEPYCTLNSGSECWHTISEMPYTEPATSSIKVGVRELEDWEDDWMDCHRDHSDPEFPDAFGNGVEYVESEEECESSGEDEDSYRNRLTLLKCCDIQRPIRKARNIVVKPANPGGFITIHDYLSTVHRWLVDARDDILTAKGVHDFEPMPSDTELIVSKFPPNQISTKEKAYWMECT